MKQNIASYFAKFLETTLWEFTRQIFKKCMCTENGSCAMTKFSQVHCFHWDLQKNDMYWKWFLCNAVKFIVLT